MSQTDDDKTKAYEAMFIELLLQNYFIHRDHLPKDGYIEEDKTTQQIIDELQPMYDIRPEDIVAYMIDHGYALNTAPDGTVAWAIWRRVEPMT